MQLYIPINQEAVDNDDTYKMEVIKRLQKQINDGRAFNAVTFTDLDDKQKQEFLKNYFIFNSKIDMQFDSKQTDNIEEMFLGYNIVSNQIQSFGYNTLTADSKNFIDSRMKKILPKIKAIAEAVTPDRSDLLDVKQELLNMVRNIEEKTYQPIVAEEREIGKRRVQPKKSKSQQEILKLTSELPSDISSLRPLIDDDILNETEETENRLRTRIDEIVKKYTTPNKKGDSVTDEKTLKRQIDASITRARDRLGRAVPLVRRAVPLVRPVPAPRIPRPPPIDVLDLDLD